MNNKKIILFLLIMVVSAIFGFIYEEIFYYIDLGYLVKRGSTFGPWIPIYAFGGLFITLLTNKYKDKPLVVFILSLVICGLLELVVGYLLLRIGNIRLWDYNTEILNFGNIGGFICLRSVTFFGISGVFLVKIIIPLLEKIINKYYSLIFRIICYIISFLFIIDVVYNYIIVKNYL